MAWKATVTASAMLASAPAIAQGPPNFEFRDAIAGVIGDPKEIGGSCLPTKVRNELRCVELRTKVADQDVRWLVALTYNHRLTSVMGVFEPASLQPMITAFTAKYGDPCDIADVEWQSPAGETVRATKRIWCFKTGKMVVQAPGQDFREGFFAYIDEWAAEAISND